MRSRARLGAILLAWALLGASAYAATEGLDPTFDGDGWVALDFGGTDIAFAAAIQPNGKMVLAGTSRYSRAVTRNSHFSLARINTHGSLDISFDIDGKLTTDFGDVDAARGVALQPDGKFVVAGDSGGLIAVARYLPNGSLDTSFDGDGKATRAGIGPVDSEVYSYAVAVEIQSDGKVVVAGSSENYWTADPVPRYESRFIVIRFKSDGGLDNSFGGDGKVAGDVFRSQHPLANAFDMTIQADGRILVVGAAHDGNGPYYNPALVRFTKEGDLDGSFGSEGRVITDFGANGGAAAVKLQPDGNIYVAGWKTIKRGSQPGEIFALSRYKPDGSIDTSFQNGGSVTPDLGVDWEAHDLALQPDGRVLVAGMLEHRAHPMDFGLARLVQGSPVELSTQNASQTVPQNAPQVSPQSGTVGARNHRRDGRPDEGVMDSLPGSDVDRRISEWDDATGLESRSQEAADSDSASEHGRGSGQSLMMLGILFSLALVSAALAAVRRARSDGPTS